MSRVQPDCVSPDRSPDELVALRRSLATRAKPLRRMADHYSLLAGETRLKIITLLTDSGELCVCDLASVLEMTPAAVSQHLSRLRSGRLVQSRLRSGRLVQSRRDGMTIYYRMTKGADGLPTVHLPGFEPAAKE